MHPRPLFYLQPYGVGITLPKETGLKTASRSTVFVTAGILFQPEYYITTSKAAQEKSTILQWSSRFLWDSYETPKQKETPAEQTPTSQGQSCLVM